MRNMRFVLSLVTTALLGSFSIAYAAIPTVNAGQTITAAGTNLTINAVNDLSATMGSTALASGQTVTGLLGGSTLHTGDTVTSLLSSSSALSAGGPTNLVDAVNSVYSQLSSPSTGLSALNTNITNLSNQVNNVSTGLPALYNQVNNVSTGLPALNTTVANLTTQVNGKVSAVSTVYVTSSGGVAALVSAVNSATGTAAQPILIKIEPGTYTLSSDLTIPKYVSLEGSGSSAGALLNTTSDNTTVTTIDTGGNGIILSGDNTLSHLVIQNTSTSAANTNLLNITSVPSGLTYNQVLLNDVAINQNGSASNVGVAINITAASQLEIYNSAIRSAGTSGASSAISVGTAGSGTIDIYSSKLSAASTSVRVLILNSTSGINTNIYDSQLTGVVSTGSAGNTALYNSVVNSGSTVTVNANSTGTFTAANSVFSNGLTVTSISTVSVSNSQFGGGVGIDGNGATININNSSAASVFINNAGFGLTSTVNVNNSNITGNAALSTAPNGIINLRSSQIGGSTNSGGVGSISCTAVIKATTFIGSQTSC